MFPVVEIIMQCVIIVEKQNVDCVSFLDSVEKNVERRKQFSHF